MNRRDLAIKLVPLIGMGTYPAAVAVSGVVKDETPAKPRTESDDDRFHIAIMFDPGKGDFVVRGIYTLKAEADAHADRLKASGHKCVVSMTANRAWLQNHFISDRLGALQDVMERLEARLMIDAHS